jgi:hypothetical protein
MCQLCGANFPNRYKVSEQKPLLKFNFRRLAKRAQRIAATGTWRHLGPGGSSGRFQNISKLNLKPKRSAANDH